MEIIYVLFQVAFSLMQIVKYSCKLYCKVNIVSVYTGHPPTSFHLPYEG